jgi:ribosomal protein L1
LKPEGVKGPFIKTAYLTTSMGPSVPLDLATTLTMKVE